jgi:low affinity Fe/Cu permease
MWGAPVTLKSTVQAGAKRVSDFVGHPSSIICAVILIAGWAVVGPMVDYSGIWLDLANTTMTVITFLMVFVLQNSQNRDGRALQLKLDNLLLRIAEADNRMIGTETKNEDDIDALEKLIKGQVDEDQ